MLPRTPDEMTSLIVMAMLTRIYGDITLAARRGRLTGHDIVTIENKIERLMRDAEDFAEEFETFEAEPACAKAMQIVEQFLAATRGGRVRQIDQKRRK